MSAEQASVAVEYVDATNAIAAADVITRGHDLYGTGVGLDHGALVRAEPPNQEEDDADTDVGEGYAHPDLVWQWFHEWHNTRVVLDRLLDHDAYAKTHKGLAKIHDLFPGQGNGQRGYDQVGFLGYKFEMDFNQRVVNYNRLKLIAKIIVF